MKYTPAAPFSIQHSGQTFTSHHVGALGNRVWPVEELFARHPMKPSVEDRVRRLTGGLIEEGCIIPGYHFRQRGKRWLKKAGRIGRRERFRRECGY